MLRATPPFRADHVGSLLRPQYLKEARAQRERGEITSLQLKETEDRAIRELIAKEESIGLEGITDGEFRRAFWHLDFLEEISGVESYAADQRIQFKGGQAKIKNSQQPALENQSVQIGILGLKENFSGTKQ